MQSSAQKAYAFQGQERKNPAVQTLLSEKSNSCHWYYVNNERIKKKTVTVSKVEYLYFAKKKLTVVQEDCLFVPFFFPFHIYTNIKVKHVFKTDFYQRNPCLQIEYLLGAAELVMVHMCEAKAQVPEEECPNGTVHLRKL